jgi:hypothetical protein
VGKYPAFTGIPPHLYTADFYVHSFHELVGHSGVAAVLMWMQITRYPQLKSIMSLLDMNGTE